MKILTCLTITLLHSISTFAKQSPGYKPMVSDGEIITIYSVEDPKRLPTVEEVRSQLKKNKNLKKENVEDDEEASEAKSSSDIESKDSVKAESKDEQEDEESESDEEEESEDESEEDDE